MKLVRFLTITLSVVLANQVQAQDAPETNGKRWYELSNMPGYKGYGALNTSGWVITEKILNIETGAIQDAQTGEWKAKKLPEEVLGPVQLYRASSGDLYMAQQIIEGGPHVGKWRMLYRTSSPAQVFQQAIAGYEQYQQYSSHGGQITQFLSILNSWRARNGRHAIGWDQNLANFAATNNAIHAPHSTGGAAQCWAGTTDMIASLYMWFNSPAHASVLLNAQSAIGAAPCLTGCTANAR